VTTERSDALTCGKGVQGCCGGPLCPYNHNLDPLPIQGVVFVLCDSLGRVLMERCPKKAARHGGEWFIPGGRVEAADGSPLAALYREMTEELGCQPVRWRTLPVIDACGGEGWPPFLVQPYMVEDYLGCVPRYTLDHPEVPLRWLLWGQAAASPSPVVRAILAAADEPSRR
jgi:8-oxo-dGTP pyrophosphatase MutT (NUDIX family)